MKCPICNIDLQMTERQGIEIDYCSQCRGVWLDRGELDKLIEKSNSTGDLVGAGRAAYQESPRPKQAFQDNRYQDDHHYGKKRKREGLLGELFDF